MYPRPRNDHGSVCVYCCPASVRGKLALFTTSLRHITFTSLSNRAPIGRGHFFPNATRDGLGKLRSIMNKPYDGGLPKLHETVRSCAYKRLDPDRLREPFAAVPRGFQPAPVTKLLDRFDITRVYKARSLYR